MLNRIVDLILSALAAYRLMWMILSENGPADILQHLRTFIYEKFDEQHWVYRGFGCPYCISFWLLLVFMKAPPFIREWFAMAEVIRRIIDHDGRNAQ